MPSTSAKQQRFMQAVAHNPDFAKKAGVKQSVGQDFVAADKKAGKKFAGGGRILKVEKGLRDAGVGDDDYAAPAPSSAASAPAAVKFDTGPRKPDPEGLKRALQKRGFAAGGSIDGCATRGKTKGRMF